jgi:hypothetical protein
VIRIQSEIKRALLRQIVEGAKSSASTVKAALIATQAAATDSSFKKGRILVSTSGNGQSASFQIAASGYSQDVFVGLTEEFINVLDDAVAAGAVDDTTQPDALFNSMCSDDRLVGIRSQMGDFTSLRFPVTR